MKSFIGEFKAFAMKGNVIDLAVAVVIGAAFGKIVSALVDSLIMPLAGLFLGGVSFSSLYFKVGGAVFSYGTLIQAVVDFLIVALVIFMVIKAMNSAQQTDKEEASAEEKPAEPSEEVKLLREIRDGLKRTY